MLAGGIDHGTLAGLADDDHPHYFLADGSRDLSGTLVPSADNSFDLGTTDRFRNLNLSGTATAPIFVGGAAATQSGSLTLHHGGIVTWWDAGNDTSVVFGPVANGTTTLGITGSLNASSNLAGATYGSNASVSDAELLYINSLSSNAQDQLDARCLEAVFGTSIGTGLLLDGTTLKASTELQGLSGLVGTGLVVHIGAGTYTERTIAGTASEVEVSNGSGVAGNPTIGLPDVVVITTSATVPTIYGSAASGGDLILEGSSHATNGDVLIQPTDGNVGIQNSTPGNQLEVTKTAIGATPVDTNGIRISNTTAAAAGAQQYSPPLVFRGSGWKTAATAASQKVEFMQDVRPVEGTSAPTGYWGVYPSINDAAYSATPAIAVTSAGNVGIGDTTPDAKLDVESGNIYLGNGNVKFETSGTGIDFSATSDATGMTSELLDDYEEGTWTPTYVAITTDFGSVTYDALTTGIYVKIGRDVICHGVLKTDAITMGAAAGNVRIAGLPFTILNTSASYGSSVSVGYSANFAGDMPSHGFCQVNSTQANLTYRTTSNGASLFLAYDDLDTGTDDNITYFTISYTAS